jgi:DNA polymerase-3 subunit alpha
MSFVHLHTHTHYSFQKALGDPEKLVKRAKELDQTAVAITDVWNLYGAFEFYEVCKKNGIKPIIGVEFLISKKWRNNRDKDNELYEIVLLAKNIHGYHNLIELVTIAHTEWYYNGITRIDFDLLKTYSENLIALSGSMYGEIGQHIITGKDDAFIVERIDFYRNIFWNENYFLELEHHPDKPMQNTINETIVRLSKKYNYEYVATNNSYYTVLDDAEVQDMMSCVALSRSLDDPDRPTLMNGDYSIRPSREMEELFIQYPKAYENAGKIADMIDLVIDYGSYKIPKFPLSDEEKIKYQRYGDFVQNAQIQFQSLSTEEWLLRSLCIEWLNYRYDFGLTEEQKHLFLWKIVAPTSQKKISEMSVEDLHTLAESYYWDEKKELIATFSDSKKEIISRLEYELSVVDLMWFNGYFCIVADFIRYAKTHGVPVWPGRGSAAWAILAYLSGITDIDPLKYGLLFERFLNPSRVSMPDIDVDFSDDGRDQVLSYVRWKYGADHVAQVCTFWTLAARAAVKDSGRALGVPFALMNDFAKLIPSRPGITIKEALDESNELRKVYEEDPKFTKVIDSAIKLEWTVRQLGVHACAVIIAPEPMKHFCPLQPPPKDPTITVTQFSAWPLETLGLLKMDFLGLRNLAILARGLKIVKDVHSIDIDLLKIDYEDQKVLDLFGEWDMTWVFQFESAGMRRYLKDLKPSSFEDLIAMVSLYRPGPMQYIPEFIDRKFGRKIVEYPHPSLEEILKPTYGIAVYQEQIMQLVQAFAGFSLGEADILRRAIGKKKYELLMEQRGKFIDAAIRQGHNESLAIYIFDEIIEPFAWYGFNKSHAACYSMIAYQTGYMKTYYPTEFMTALMMSDESDIDRMRLEIEEAREKWVQILPPDINESRRHFTFIDNSHIRFGLQAIKWIWDWPIGTIRKSAKEKTFTSMQDFIERTGGDVINKKTLEWLIYSWALDLFGDRASLLASITKMTAYLKEIEAKKETSQMGLFDSMTSETHSSDVHGFTLEHDTPMSFEARMKWEKATIGYPVSGHPLDGLSEFIQKKSKNTGPIYEWLNSRAEKIDVVPEVWIVETKWEWENEEKPQDVIKTEEISDNDAPPPILAEEEVIDIPEKKEVEESVFATLIGLVHDVRKIQTKTGGMMLMATLESAGFDFRLTIFSRDYETFADKVEEDKILVVDGRVKFDTERDEISISPWAGFSKKWWNKEAIKSFTITQFRDIALSSWLVTPESLPEYAIPKGGSIATHTESQNSLVKKYFIDVPSYWSKDDLLDLRDFLEKSPVWLVPVWIRIGWKEKDTKFTIEDVNRLEAWIKIKGV